MNTFLLTTVTVCLTLLSSCRSIEEKPRDSDIAGTYYHVRKGDSLAAISRKYRVSVSEIKEVNGVDDDRQLQPGRALYLPHPDPIGKKIEALRPKPKTTVAKKATPQKLEQSGQRIFDNPLPRGTVIYSFSKAKKNPYEGIGIKAPLYTPVMSAQSGRVLFVGDDGTKFGLLVIVEHKEPFITVYAHLNEARVKAGQSIGRGETIGTVGRSGGASVPHLHFQIRVDRNPKDPKLYLKS